MFDEEQPALESEQERSARHARMVFQAVLFTIFLPTSLFAFGGVWLWMRDGSVDVGGLLVPFLIVVTGVGAGMIYELRKRW